MNSVQEACLGGGAASLCKKITAFFIGKPNVLPGLEILNFSDFSPRKRCNFAFNFKEHLPIYVDFYSMMKLSKSLYFASLMQRYS